MKCRNLTLLAAVVTAFIAGFPCNTSLSQAPTPLKRSEVVMSYPFVSIHDQYVYEKYAPTRWGWGPDPGWVNSSWGRDHTWLVNNAFAKGMSVVSTQVNPSIMPNPANNDLIFDLATNPLLRAARCIDLEGNTFPASWWPVNYGDGEYAWWHCTNNPHFVEHVHERIRVGFESGANAYMMDIPYGTAMQLWTSNAGCFCSYCEAGFRSFLQENYTIAELASMGIENIDTFNYRQVVRQVTTDNDDFLQRYWSNRHSLPLIDQFEMYQYSAGTEFIRGVSKIIDGYGVSFGANCSGLSPLALMAVDYMDYFVIEISHYTRPGKMAILPYKIADKLDKGIASWPVGADVQKVSQFNATGMLQRWIAHSYCQGGNMMVPYKLWLETTTSGAEFLNIDHEDFAPLYNFVSNNAELFDDYEAVEQVALIYSNRALREWNSSVRTASYQLMEANVPYGLALAGDYFLNRTLNEDELNQYELVVVPEPTLLEGEQNEIVDRLKTSGKAVTWTNAHDIMARITPWVSVETGNNIWLFPRKKDNDPDAPVVVHLLNGDYDQNTDQFGVHSNAVIKLNSELFGSKNVVEVTFLNHEGSVENLPFVVNEDDITVTVPELKLWGLLKINTLGNGASDSNNDGIVDLLAYALNAFRYNISTDALPTISISENACTFEIGDTRASAVSYDIDCSADLLTWYRLAFKQTGGIWVKDTIDDATAIYPGIERVAMQLTLRGIQVEQAHSEDKIYYKLKVRL